VKNDIISLNFGAFNANLSTYMSYWSSISCVSPGSILFFSHSGNNTLSMYLLHIITRKGYFTLCKKPQHIK